MGGYSFEDDREYFPSTLTLLLVGRTGNGKSSTGNSIIGSEVFVSKLKLGGVTITSELKTTKLEDGPMLNVIDTPGLFDSSANSEFIGKEIVGCLHMVKGGIHGFLVVFSILSGFSEEETAVISCLVTLFGTKIYDHMIIAFTGGDELEKDGRSLEEFMCDCPEALKEILLLCGNRYVLFDNRTKDHTKKVKQVQQLLSYVNKVLKENDGGTYTNEIFIEAKWESKLKEMEARFEKRLKEERAVGEKAMKDAEKQQQEFKDEINKLKEELDQVQKPSSRCVIM